MPLNYSALIIFAKVNNDQIDEFNRLLSIIHKTLTHLRNLSWTVTLLTTWHSICFSDSCCLRLDWLYFHLEMLVTARFCLGFFPTIFLEHHISSTIALQNYLGILLQNICIASIFATPVVYNRTKNLHFNITLSRFQCMSLVFWLKLLAHILRYVKFHLQLFTVNLKIYFSSPYLYFKLLLYPFIWKWYFLNNNNGWILYYRW